MQYFITYVLGHQPDSGKKAELGTIVHKVMETLAQLKKYQQDNPKKLTLSIEDDALKTVSIKKNELLTNTLVDKLLSRSFDFYTGGSKHTFTKGDRDLCLKLVWDTLKYNDGQFDPRLRKIVAAEPHFDIPIDEDWAFYEYEVNGQKVKGQLAIKGTIDLVTETDDGIIEVVDWKGLPIDTPLPTPNGWTTMGEVKIGDKVFDQYGNRCSVVGKSQVKSRKCFKITFDDSTSAICDDEHLWKLSDGKTVPIQELVVGNKINVCKPINCDNVDLPIDPYLLGVWLGDGRNRKCELSGNDIEIFEEIEKRGYKLGKIYSDKRSDNKTVTVFEMTDKLRSLNLLNDKHIPKIYLRASFQQRLDLLRGLMDTDGNANTTRKQAVFTSCNKKLSDNVKELLLTLGQRPNQCDIKRDTNFKKDVSVYPIAFRPIDINPFLLKRKSDKINPKWGSGMSGVRRIVSIIEHNIEETQCISVDSLDNTYLCTKNFIPTHNTGRRLDWATGEEKTYGKLCSDPQLLLYNYAISKLFPQYKQSIMSIFFIKDGGPFSMCFDKADEKKFLEMLKERFLDIKKNEKPQPISPNRESWKCTKLCHYCKNKWPETDQNMCIYIENSIKTKGMDQTIKDCTRSGFDIGFYSAPG
jgi:hypothetical protein